MKPVIAAIIAFAVCELETLCDESATMAEEYEDEEGAKGIDETFGRVQDGQEEEEQAENRAGTKRIRVRKKIVNARKVKREQKAAWAKHKVSAAPKSKKVKKIMTKGRQSPTGGESRRRVGGDQDEDERAPPTSANIGPQKGKAGESDSQASARTSIPAPDDEGGSSTDEEEDGVDADGNSPQTHLRRRKRLRSGGVKSSAVSFVAVTSSSASALQESSRASKPAKGSISPSSHLSSLSSTDASSSNLHTEPHSLTESGSPTSPPISSVRDGNVIIITKEDYERYQDSCYCREGSVKFLFFFASINHDLNARRFTSRGGDLADISILSGGLRESLLDHQAPQPGRHSRKPGFYTRTIASARVVSTGIARDQNSW